jgi:hypothetical protein
MPATSPPFLGWSGSTGQRFFTPFGQHFVKCFPHFSPPQNSPAFGSYCHKSLNGLSTYRHINPCALFSAHRSDLRNGGDNRLRGHEIVGRRNSVEYDPATAEETTVKLTAEQEARAFAAYGVCGNEACDRCGKVLAEVRWTRRDMPETYCSQLCRDGVERTKGRCDGCGVDLAGKRRGARWCSDSYRMRSRVKDSANNPKTPIQNIGLTVA